jgi:3',5'-cyclic AMP phosphodiesterase CpdA
LLRLENINPIKAVINNKDNVQTKIADPHTVLLTANLKSNEDKTIEITSQDNGSYFEIVILGDNRNGYDTFSRIIQQINSLSPVFVIDNGDLVFGGEPHKYRLFYETVSKLQVPLFTTLGNHDIRENGRPTYTKLFGPPYYSFDYRGIHFVFLDSSRGWAEKRAISEEQYQWLENDLKNAKSKRIFVISHIPPTDPRTYKDPNKLPDIPGIEKENAFERMMDNYSQYKSLNHGFPDKEEAKRFESIMSKYKVETVFMSHIHSYFSYIKDGVHYIISGGAGAELLTKDSYYHYIRVKVTNTDSRLEIVQLPSPANDFQDRYIAAIKLFAKSTYREYKTAIIIIGSLILLVLAWIVWITRYKWWPFIKFIIAWLLEIVKFAVSKFKEMKEKR